MLRTAADVTPKGLTSVFQREGVLDYQVVERVEIVLEKELAFSHVARICIIYDGEVHNLAPDSVFLKVSPHSASEARFYLNVARKRPHASLIRCFDAGICESDNSYLLLEDLTESHTQPGKAQPPSRASSEAAVSTLARFHAEWWDDPILGSEIGTFHDGAWLESFLRDLEKSVSLFLATVPLSQERRAIYDRLVASGRSIWGRLTSGHNLTVTNGDCHWWNFLYPKESGSNDVRLMDWQLWHIDVGARDLAFLLALGGFAERRPEIEMHLMETYYNTLVGTGVRNYCWDDFLLDYRSSVLRNLNIPVIFWSGGRDESEWRPLLDRAFKSYDEFNCEELIS